MRDREKPLTIDDVVWVSYLRNSPGWVVVVMEGSLVMDAFDSFGQCRCPTGSFSSTVVPATSPARRLLRAERTSIRWYGDVSIDSSYIGLD